MHRQSLGSPNSKLHSHGVIVTAKDNADVTTDDQRRNSQLPSQIAGGDDVDIDQLRKSQRPQKSSEKLIHIIPMLIVFCFLILYLSSHDPSQKESAVNLKCFSSLLSLLDLTNFNGYKRSSKPIEISSEIDDFGGLLETGKSDVLAIRSMRNLQEIDKKHSQNHRLHRKMADF